MKPSRLENHKALSLLTDQELCVMIRAELSGWERDRRIALTTFPVPEPDWINSALDLARLERFVIRKAGALVYREELAKVAGDFNPSPTPRQRREAILAAAVRVRTDVIATISS
jgi:hypothetical protein